MFGKRFELNEQTIPVVEELGRQMPGGFFIYRAEQPETLLYANRACIKLFGCRDLDEFKELTGFTFRGMLHPDDYDAVSASVVEQIARSEGDLDRVEYRIVRRDGSVRWMEDYGHYTDTEAYGGVYYVFISDITEEHDKRETDRQIRDAVIHTLTTGYHTVWLINDVETETVSLYHVDSDEEHAEATGFFLRHGRYSEGVAEYIGTLVAPEDRERLSEELSLPYVLSQLETRERFSVTFLRVLRAGPRYYRADLGKVSMPGGRTGVMIGLYDVDEEVRHELAFRRELEARLALQEKLLEQEKRRKEQDAMITAMASDYRSVYHVDLDRNDAVCYRADDETAKSTPVGEHFPYLERFTAYCENCVDAEYKEGFLQFIDPEHIREALATEAIIAYRYLARAHGREYYEMLRMAGVRRPGDRDDHMVHAVGVGFTEIDAEMRESLSRSRALREALAAAQQASRAKTAFLSSMSHEIRTPMNAIIGLNHIALSEPDLPEKVAEYLRKMDESAEHLLGIINDILDMSRIESGRMVIRNEEFSFSEMLEQVNAIIGEQCREKGLSYECRTSGRIDERYTGDDVKLSQVLINILGNSVKFTPEGGSVSFLIEEGPRFGGEATLRFTVRDTGIGMSKEFLPRIFDPFSQEDSSTTSRYGSTGLGMPITKSIVELMNGSISVESEKGAGSTFTVTVTLGEAACGDGAQTPDGSGVGQGRTVLEGRRVLLAEDVPINAEITVMVLGMREIEADVAENGRAALETFLSHPEGYYDAILMDMRMPEMDGLEATRAIRACGRADAGTIPIIALTANAFDEDVQRSLQAGLNAHLSKPVEADALFEALERLIPGEGVSK